MVLLTPGWQAPPYVVAYCTTREGGLSTGDYQGLNVGMHVGDTAHVVAKNRQSLPNFKKIAWLNQTHSDTVIDLDASSARDGDASVCRTSRFQCAVMTADCVPVLVFSRSQKEVAAIHAGWKGLASGIIAKTIDSMLSSASDLCAWIGPAISGKCYEVDLALAEKFSVYSGAVTQIDRVTKKARLNIPHIAKLQLHDVGVGEVIMSDMCTYSAPATFFSHRYATHQNKKATGRMVSVIGLE